MSFKKDTVLGRVEEQQRLGGRWKEGRGGQVGAAEQMEWFVDWEAGSSSS